jgi:hypothetical protein
MLLWVIVSFAGLMFVWSCSKKEKSAENAARDTTKTISYVSEEISFGVFFDEQGTKRTMKLGKGESQTKVYLFVNFPSTLQLSAVEYRLSLPQGVTIESDKFYEKRVALLGTFEDGISETFPCAAGPKLLLHALTVNVPGNLTDAEFAIVSSKDNNFLGVATCDEGAPMIQASSYRAVLNPTE